MISINNVERCERCFSVLDNGECRHCCTPHLKSPDAFHPGAVVAGRYVIGGYLYNDDTANCYIGFDPETEERLIIREFFAEEIMSRTDAGAIEVKGSLSDEETKHYQSRIAEFSNEAQLTARFEKTGKVTKLCDYFNDNNTAYAVFKLPENGVFLNQYVQEHGGKLSADEVTAVLKDIIEALFVIHDNNAIHGNLRPESIILTDEGVVFTCFCTGVLGGGSGRVYGAKTDKNPYAALERYSERDNTGPWTDIYSLGQVLSYMLTGNTPINFLTALDGGNDELGGFYPYASDGLLKALEKMTDISIANRPKELRELCKFLKENNVVNIKYAPEYVPSALPKTAEIREKSRKRPIIIIAMVIVFCAAIAAAGIKIFYDNKTVSEESQTETEETSNDEGTDESISPKPEENAPQSGVDTTEAPIEGIADIPDVSLAPAKSGAEFADSKNVMMSTEGSEAASAVFGNENYSKERIISIEFSNSLSGISNISWDISENKDGSVKAWLIKEGRYYRLFIGAQGGVRAGRSAKAMFMGYTNVEEIKLSGCLNTETTEDMSFMFKNCKKLKTLDLTSLNTSFAKDMTSMFENCFSMTELTLSRNFKTFNVTSMKQMFDSCRSLSVIDVSMFNTVKVTDMSKMFFGCRGVRELSLISFNTANVIDMSNMFYKCTNLETLDFGSCKILDSTNISGMFDYCENLTELKTVSEVILREYKRSAGR